MRKTIAFLVFSLIAGFAFPQRVSDLNGNQAQLYPDKDHAPGWARPGGGSGQDLRYHGGPVIVSANTVAIFWGSYWGTNGNLNAEASEMLGFYSHFGTSPEYNTITEYSGIQLSNLTNNYWLDTSNPPANVTDSLLQGEVVKYLNAHGANANTIYEVTDPDGDAWYDRRGNEADDKCAWSPAPFIGSGGYGYQWEWSNLAHGCIQSR